MSKWLGSFLVMLTLVGCSNNPQRQAVVKDMFRKPQAVDLDPTFKAVADSGAPAMLVGIQGREGSYSGFVRQHVNAQGIETWISGDKLLVALDDGMLVATRGLGGDLLAADASQTAQAIRAGQPGVVEHFVTRITGEDQAEILAFRCRVSRGPQMDVTLSATQTVKADVWQETCRNNALTFKNTYWVVQGSGDIVQSVQWASTVFGSLALRTVPR
jgi:hypothetical protein